MLKKLIANPYLYTLLLTYYGIWLLWDAIKIPFSNPGNVISLLPQVGYNPTNNILRFAIAVLLPPVACLVLWLILNKKLAVKLLATPARKRIVSGLVIGASIILCICMGIVQNSTNAANNPEGVHGGPYGYAQLDTFHEGETLGPAISYQDKDLKPYRDFVIVHGVFQDPLRTVIAFKLFGQSIGASRAFAVILGIFTFIAYFALLIVLFRGNLLKSSSALWILSALLLPLSTLPVVGHYIYGVQFPFRDIATILFLIAAITGLRAVAIASKKRLAIAGFLIGFIVIVGFANSIDRAFYIAALSLVWLALVAFTDTAKIFIKQALVPYILGAVLGIPVLGLALKWAFRDFAAYLLAITKYKEYLDGIIFGRPNVAVSLILIILSALITVGGAYLLRTLNNRKISNEVALPAKLRTIRTMFIPVIREHGIVIMLFATAIVFLRSAIGRALPDHFIYSVQWLYLLLVYISFQYLSPVFKAKKEIFGFIAILLLGVFTAFYAVSVKRINLAVDTFPINTNDERYMRTDHVQTAKYLKENLKGDERFVTFTSEAAWYYFVDQPSPIKYPVIWYAFLEPERRYIADELTNQKNIKYVVLNNNWTTNFDYVPNEVRFPEAYAVLKEKFIPYKGIGQQTIWIRK